MNPGLKVGKKTKSGIRGKGEVVWGLEFGVQCLRFKVNIEVEAKVKVEVLFYSSFPACRQAGLFLNQEASKICPFE